MPGGTPFPENFNDGTRTVAVRAAIANLFNEFSLAPASCDQTAVGCGALSTGDKVDTTLTGNTYDIYVNKHFWTESSVTNCNQQDGGPALPVPCDTYTTVDTTSDPPNTHKKHYRFVRKIVADRCTAACHKAPTASDTPGSFPDWLDFTQLRTMKSASYYLPGSTKAQAMLQRNADGTMPPGFTPWTGTHFTAEEVSTIQDWINCSYRDTPGSCFLLRATLFWFLAD